MPKPTRLRHTKRARSGQELLADDFAQYYLGAYARAQLSSSGVVGIVGLLAGLEALFGGSATVDNPVDEAGAFIPTSDVLPQDEFPQFASASVADYLSPEGPFFAVEGDYLLAAPHADDSYMRVGRTFDLTSAPEAPTFEAQFSWDVEADYDHVIVEARAVGTENWTTLPDLNKRHDDRSPRRVRGRLRAGGTPQPGEVHHPR